MYTDVQACHFTHFSEAGLLFSCLIFVAPLWAPMISFIEPPEPPVFFRHWAPLVCGGCVVLRGSLQATVGADFRRAVVATALWR